MQPTSTALVLGACLSAFLPLPLVSAHPTFGHLVARHGSINQDNFETVASSPAYDLPIYRDAFGRVTKINAPVPLADAETEAKDEGSLDPADELAYMRHLIKDKHHSRRQAKRQ